jgi:hypothetical protein
MLDASPFEKLVHRGEWPGRIDALPLIMAEKQVAHMLGVTVRTLQRKRYEARSKGRDWIAYKKVGKSIMYRRDDVLAHYGLVGPSGGGGE